VVFPLGKSGFVTIGIQWDEPSHPKLIGRRIVYPIQRGHKVILKLTVIFGVNELLAALTFAAIEEGAALLLVDAL
jgi:hypothetical protein